MVKAYILLTSAIGRVKDVFDRLKGLKNVKTVSIVTGPYDLIVLVEAEDLSTLTNTVVEEIREIEGVVDTNTAIIVQ
ncbi:AsnC family transcriptional regulator [candidate division MSBL1 archaeon SCGC-AAA259I09]|uniref:AsnC family transcriptional regulator n=2 Tax=candidate division MSBL1 TaxID=215777 RepID=A0A133UTX1_9EURY|nr:AsnC family transcriptional regulator [candidate division MSBL1 archaeon SCGC-AAA259I09]KXA98863.1 AsnC family transcriptional regulator [candidate division MSBL1 archaeon SCGC-AAA259J03]